jgi:2'-5' RNA ligase
VKPSGGGRTWWAHLEFTHVNIELTILQKEIEELMNVKGIGEKSFLKLKPHVTVAAGKAGQGEKQ